MEESEALIVWAWIVSIFCVGGMIGGSCVGLIASRLGRFTLETNVKGFNFD